MEAEPLTSSAIDIWSKRTSKLIVNDWYMVDNYHTDTGEVDAYSAGRRAVAAAAEFGPTISFSS